jgi:hypothetical protein
VAVAERIEQGVKSGRISALIEKRGFEGKGKEVDHVESGYIGRRNSFQNYHTPSQIANINLNSPFPTKKNMSPKTSKPKAKLKISQRRITKGTRNNYPHYLCL